MKDYIIIPHSTYHRRTHRHYEDHSRREQGACAESFRHPVFYNIEVVIAFYEISSRVTLDAVVPDGFEVLTAPGTDRLKILIQPAA